MLTRTQLSEILQLALSQGGDFADVFIENRQTNSIVCEENKVERINSGVDLGAGIRAISGESTAYAYTNDLTMESLRRAAKIVSHAAKTKHGTAEFDLCQRNPVLDFTVEQRPDQVKVETKVEAVLRANKAARKVDERVKQVTVAYGDIVQKVWIANSEGDYVEDERIRTRFIVNAIAVDGEKIQTGYDSVGGFRGFELLEQDLPEQLANSAAKRAVMMLEAKPAPAGKMPVVMAGDAGGTMVHEACGHGLEADLAQKGLSVYAGKLGEEVASPLVSVIDDGTIQYRYGSYRFDDEGTQARKNVLIENGVLKSYMYDRLTAHKEARESTGNGRRESFHHKPIPRMTNTYIAPGKMDPEKIIRETKDGLLVRKMGGGQVNTVNGDFVFDVAEGYLIKDGEVIAPVRGATLTGNGPEVLKIIDMVGSDLGFTIGTCGKDGQGVPVSDAQPTLHISELLVGGTEVAGNAELKPIKGYQPKIRRV